MVILSADMFKRFVDDSHARIKTREQSLQFLDILNSQDPLTQYTIEFDNEDKEHSFLDVTIKNTRNDSYDFKILRKTLITNVQIKPKSNIAPQITMGVFTKYYKGFLWRAYKICTEKYYYSKIEFLTEIFTENGHERNTQTKVKQRKKG